MFFLPVLLFSLILSCSSVQAVHPKDGRENLGVTRHKKRLQSSQRNAHKKPTPSAANKGVPKSEGYNTRTKQRRLRLSKTHHQTTGSSAQRSTPGDAKSPGLYQRRSKKRRSAPAPTPGDANTVSQNKRPRSSTSKSHFKKAVASLPEEFCSLDSVKDIKFNYEFYVAYFKWLKNHFIDTMLTESQRRKLAQHWGVDDKWLFYSLTYKRNNDHPGRKHVEHFRDYYLVELATKLKLLLKSDCRDCQAFNQSLQETINLYMQDEFKISSSDKPTGVITYQDIIHSFPVQFRALIENKKTMLKTEVFYTAYLAWLNHKFTGPRRQQLINFWGNKDGWSYLALTRKGNEVIKCFAQKDLKSPRKRFDSLRSKIKESTSLDASLQRECAQFETILWKTIDTYCQHNGLGENEAQPQEEKDHQFLLKTLPREFHHLINCQNKFSTSFNEAYFKWLGNNIEAIPNGRESLSQKWGSKGVWVGGTLGFNSVAFKNQAGEETQKRIKYFRDHYLAFPRDKLKTMFKKYDLGSMNFDVYRSFEQDCKQFKDYLLGAINDYIAFESDQSSKTTSGKTYQKKDVLKWIPEKLQHLVKIYKDRNYKRLFLKAYFSWLHNNLTPAQRSKLKKYWDIDVSPTLSYVYLVKKGKAGSKARDHISNFTENYLFDLLKEYRAVFGIISTREYPLNDVLYQRLKHQCQQLEKKLPTVITDYIQKELTQPASNGNRDEQDSQATESVYSQSSTPQRADDSDTDSVATQIEPDEKSHCWGRVAQPIKRNDRWLFQLENILENSLESAETQVKLLIYCSEWIEKNHPSLKGTFFNISTQWIAEKYPSMGVKQFHIRGSEQEILKTTLKDLFGLFRQYQAAYQFKKNTKSQFPRDQHLFHQRRIADKLAELTFNLNQTPVSHQPRSN